MQFTWHEKFTKALMMIEDEHVRLKAIEAIIMYGSFGEMPEDLGIMESLIFEFAKDDIDNSHSKRAGGSKGGSKLASNEASKLASKLPNKLASEDKTTSEQASLQAKQTIQTNIQTNKQKEKKEKKKFKPPTIDEVRSLCDEREYVINPEQFVSFYASKDWMVGKNKMKDWKAALASWNAREKPKGVSVNARKYDDVPVIELGTAF